MLELVPLTRSVRASQYSRARIRRWCEKRTSPCRGGYLVKSFTSTPVAARTRRSCLTGALGKSLMPSSAEPNTSTRITSTHASDPRPHVVIVGGGFAGLTAA